MGFDGVPGTQEDDVRHEDLVFEGRSEVALGFGQGFLDLAADAGDCADRGAFELCDFKRRAEHVFDESGVFEDLVGVAGQFEFLDNFGALIDVEDHACGGEAEAWVFVGEGLHGAEARVGRCEGSPESSRAVHVFGRVLEHAVAHSVLVDAVHGCCLEAAPAQTDDQWIVGLKDLLVPSVTLDADLNEAHALFCGLEAADEEGVSWVVVFDELRRDVVQDESRVGACLVALGAHSGRFVQFLELSPVDVLLLLKQCLLCVVPFILAEFALFVLTVGIAVGVLRVQESLSVFLFETELQFFLATGVLLTLCLEVLPFLRSVIVTRVPGVLEVFELAVTLVVLIAFTIPVESFEFAQSLCVDTCWCSCCKAFLQSIDVLLVGPLALQRLVVKGRHHAVFFVRLSRRLPFKEFVLCFLLVSISLLSLFAPPLANNLDGGQHVVVHKSCQLSNPIRLLATVPGVCPLRQSTLPHRLAVLVVIREFLLVLVACTIFKFLVRDGGNTSQVTVRVGEGDIALDFLVFALLVLAGTFHLSRRFLQALKIGLVIRVGTVKACFILGVACVAVVSFGKSGCAAALSSSVLYLFFIVVQVLNSHAFAKQADTLVVLAKQFPSSLQTNHHLLAESTFTLVI